MTRLTPQRLLACLEADYRRMHTIAAQADLSAQVPTCPDWTLDDLLWHVATVYLHKAEAMRANAWPRPWPPERTGTPAAEVLADAYQRLLQEFSARPVDEVTLTWFEPEQTVGFWIRRMAQESVVHRIDAELAAGLPVETIPDDLAVDGVDELLRCFLSYGSVAWQEEFSGALASCTGQQVLVRAGGFGWLVKLEPSGVVVDDVPAASTVDTAIASVVAPAPLMLQWLWRRVPKGAVEHTGDQVALAKLWELLRTATQ